jgi:hypothetical protein
MSCAYFLNWNSADFVTPSANITSRRRQELADVLSVFQT